jgi:hypothetical protein
MSKRRCVFTESLEAEYPFLKEDQQMGKLLCSICKSQFSIQHGGRSDIPQHIKKRKHAIAAETKSCSKKITSYFTKETITDECKHIADGEGLFAFHTIKHNHSFRSMDCTSSVIRRLHEENFSFGRTKCGSIVVNVLAPFATQQIFEELEKCYVSYEFVHIANISKTMMDEWNTKSLTTFGRWSETFVFVQSECISLKTHNSFWNFFAIPGTSAAIEGVFSITDALWTDEKSRFFVETIKAVIITKTHFEEILCNYFYTLISNNPKLLQEIRSSTKYKTSIQEGKKLLQHLLEITSNKIL